MFWCVFFSIVMFTTAVNIEHVADGCVRLIQPPSADYDIDMLTRTLDVNCLKYYNVHVEPDVSRHLMVLYQRSIAAAVRYGRWLHRRERLGETVAKKARSPPPSSLR